MEDSFSKLLHFAAATGIEAQFQKNWANWKIKLQINSNLVELSLVQAPLVSSHRDRTCLQGCRNLIKTVPSISQASLAFDLCLQRTHNLAAMRIFEGESFQRE